MTSASLRQCVLMVSVLHGIDVIPRDDGVSLPPSPSVASSGELFVPWSTIESVVRDFSDVTDADARKHLAHWFTTARGLGDLSSQDFLTHVTVIGMPHNAPQHPGPAWTHTEVLGGALDLGLGLRLLGHLSDETAALTPELMTAIGHDSARAWNAAWTYLNAMGQLAADRHDRDPVGVLRPMGDCDVVSLLGSPHFRACLARFHNVGMRAVAVPIRTRGWVDPEDLPTRCWSPLMACGRPSPARTSLTLRCGMKNKPAVGLINRAFGLKRFRMRRQRAVCFVALAPEERPNCCSRRWQLCHLSSIHIR